MFDDVLHFAARELDGAGTASADPYLLRGFSKPTTILSWRA